ncbi:heterokaryon incompatibility protein-domain-containing protein [Boeremia exigua]|uniref:heterokaryon incompatibility protein-domain-containing protein n=1 Tax=Boeremia exigua TaxID=749465 RepID=UPI001E8E4A9D|nr:heterokaryon incompatibility protein-domain-containing protein [Boeremia exigua]KAH6638480.1 heterokaryon incompatibility protein-domain-containing protein [Boeremia exigua]
MPSSRRGSTSSTETVVPELGERRDTTGSDSGPCARCRDLVFSVLPSSSLLEEQLIAGSRDSQTFDTSLRPASKKKAHLCNSLGLQDLKVSARRCKMCRNLWRMLQGADGTLLDQVTKYSNDTFNATNLYLPDGGTDLEELLNPGPKVKLSASASLQYPERSQPEFHLQFPRHRRWSHVKGTAITRWFHSRLSHLGYQDPPEELSTRKFDSTLLLRLQLHVTYKVQPKHRESNTTTVQENFILFWSSVIDGKDLGRDIPDSALLTLIPQDLRLDVDRKWSLLASWMAKAPQAGSEHRLNGYPSRVLDLSRDGRVRLVGPRNEPYAALSHRWGTSRHFTTTARTIDELKSGISTEVLPQTFRDAISVARRLGVNFLWIDALCIVQDDEDDWRRESKIMGDIFMHAKTILAAHCAADDSDGFLMKALSPRSATEFELPDTSELKGIMGVYRRTDLEVDVTNSALSKRGWVLQERFLATHTLHFTKHGVLSEAGSEVFSEDGPLEPRARHGGRTAFLGPSALPDLRSFLTDFSSNGRAGLSYKTPLDWLTLMEMYTNCDLTREEDKLFAIAGVARKIQLRKESVWCAGLWSDRISHGLLWFPGQRLNAPVNTRAPSWSWAAWDGSIQYPEILQRSSFEARAHFVSVHDMRPNSASGGTKWLDSSGLLSIRACVISLEDVVVTQDHAQVGPGPDRRGYLTSDHRDLPRLALKQYLLAYELRGRRHTSKRQAKGPRLVVRVDQLPPCGWLTFDDSNSLWTQRLYLDDESSVVLKDCCFALLGTFRAANQGLVYLGLFLQLVDGCNGEDQVYRRIGCGQLSHSFISGGDLGLESQRPEGLPWSTESDNGIPQLPAELARMSTITIQ